MRLTYHLWTNQTPRFFLVDMHQIFIYQQYHHIILPKYPQQPRMIASIISLKRNGIASVTIILPRTSRINPRSIPTKAIHHTRRILNQTYNYKTSQQPVGRRSIVPTIVQSLDPLSPSALTNIILTKALVLLRKLEIPPQTQNPRLRKTSDLGLASSRLHGEVENHKTTNYRMATFIYVDAYQHGQFL